MTSTLLNSRAGLTVTLALTTCCFMLGGAALILAQGRLIPGGPPLGALTPVYAALMSVNIAALLWTVRQRPQHAPLLITGAVITGGLLLGTLR